MDFVKNGLLFSKNTINTMFGNTEPWQIASITASSILTSIWLWNFLVQDESFYVRTKKFAFTQIKKIPKIAQKIEEETKQISDTFENDVIENTKSEKYIVKLPVKGIPSDEIINTVNRYLDLGKYKWKEGYISGAVYYYDEKLIELLTTVYGLASYTNPLHSDIFPGICKMEAEVVRVVGDLFHGGSNVCGTMTSGGTESIIMACKAYRDYGKNERGIKNGVILAPKSVHPAFDKAASYFAIRINHIDLDPENLTVNLKKMENAITKNTILLVGSFPNFPYGTSDDIEGISNLGLKYNIPVHVDCCLGGFIAAFMPLAGYSLPPFDFILPGVTSISADSHKYGFAPKGSSIILYSDKKFRHHQYYVCTEWPGGHYGSPTIGGSRSGGIIAACWATLMHFGLDGYVASTKAIIKTKTYIEEELRKMNDIFIFGTPTTSVVAIGSNSFNIYRLSDALNSRGWNLNMLQFPMGIHICVTHLHTKPGVASLFIEDIKKELDEIMKNPKVELTGKIAMYGMSATLPDRTIVGDITRYFIDAMYYTPS
ncbi:sphingosine-1-phosphate lyase isoform X1 [Adelges cooleyi]|uniref:sphingosine-1-phosphate lyase isoform X1 n=1 Tax=Adelges cooleyi TaxID=133065 RepID=UPI0021807CE6|nr:sphingosine-1-phosphate lyase isoform X1 [Adelges cooleyi]XP_050429259.1 sphingosine-1-phosphate lyase isoform X1 [Adelges cooleyi]XP_050429260.1 sphingosine-1-phosphate lyase isoform X1 [Adelges cooleyi]